MAYVNLCSMYGVGCLTRHDQNQAFRLKGKEEGEEERKRRKKKKKKKKGLFMLRCMSLGSFNRFVHGLALDTNRKYQVLDQDSRVVFSLLTVHGAQFKNDLLTA